MVEHLPSTYQAPVQSPAPKNKESQIGKPIETKSRLLVTRAGSRGVGVGMNAVAMGEG